MRLAGVRRSVICLLLCGGLSLCGAGSASAASVPSNSGGSPLIGALVVPEEQLLDNGAQTAAAAVAATTSPEAVAARTASRTEYEQQGTAQAAHTLATLFPTLIGKPEGGPPPLPSGESVTGFAAANVADVSLAGGHDDAVVTSTVPMATETSAGHWAPVNLSLRDSGSALEPANPLVPSRLPKQLTEGAQLPSVGASLTPVSEHGAPLKGSPGQDEGAAVLFANTQHDSDTLMKPTPLGVDVSTTLRSIASPEQLFYKVGVPHGARLLTQAGRVTVVKEGATLATIRVPTAYDATGAAVPVTMSVSEDVLNVSVTHRPEAWTYPIVVDPEFDIEWVNIFPSMWEFHEWAGYKYSSSLSDLEMSHTGSFAVNDYAEWSEHAQGYTKLYYLYVKDSLSPTERTGKGEEEATPSFLAAWIELFAGENSRENYTLLSHPYVKEATVCHNPGTCNAEGVSQENAAGFELNTDEAGSTSFEGYIFDVSSAFAQERGKHSEVSINTGSEHLAETENIFWSQSKSSWLGPHHGAFEFEAKDGGMGVVLTRLEYKPAGGSSWEYYGGKEYKGTASCKGVECKPTQNETYGYNDLLNSKGQPVPEGEGTIRPWAGSVMPYSGSSEYPTAEKTIKVDAAKPHSITLHGLENALEEGVYRYRMSEQEDDISIEATDGEAGHPSSGIEAIELEVDGHALTPRHRGTCSPGPCTATAEWAVNGGELGAGSHTITVVARDNAGNLETVEAGVRVFAARPVGVGPGSVNPESGDFAMESTDVSLSGGIGALTFSRHYDSRNVTEGEEDPLGPQWSTRLNFVANLTVLPDNSVMLVGPTGLAHFTPTSNGGFEAPQGDSNLTLEYKAEYEGKEPAYILKDSKEDATTVFRLPSGAKQWMAALTADQPPPIPTPLNTAPSKMAKARRSSNAALELGPHPMPRRASAKNSNAAAAAWNSSTMKKQRPQKAKPRANGATTTTNLRKSYPLPTATRSAEWLKCPSPPTSTTNWAACAPSGTRKSNRHSKTTYGYDAEGHVTAMTPPGQASWAFTYGTLLTDPTNGRLIKVTRAPATAELWNGSLTANSERPTISGHLAVGETLTVSRGTWSGAPIVYEYAWNRCNSHSECTAILGATNATYLLTTADRNEKLTVTVSATNGGGSTAVTTAATATVEPEIVYNLPTGSAPTAITDDQATKWFIDSGSNKIGHITRSGEQGESSALPTGSQPQGIAGVGRKAETEGAWWADKGTAKVGHISNKTKTITEFAVASGAEPADVAAVTEEEALFTERATNKIGRINIRGEVTAEYSLAAYPGKPEQIIGDNAGNLLITHIGSGISSSIIEINTSGTILHNYPVAGEPKGIADDGLYDFYTVDADGSAPKLTHVEQFAHTVTEYAMPTGTGEPRGVAVCWEHLAYIAKSSGGASIFGQSSLTGVMSNETLPAEDGEVAALAEGSFSTVWFTSKTANKVFDIPCFIEPVEQPQPEPGTTIEYEVAPYASGLPDVEESPTWGQPDRPAEGMALVPPNHPKGWPAVSYAGAGATVYYTDRQGRLVNVVNPFGGVSSEEYNERNEVTRQLSATNRAWALEQPKPEEAAKNLWTESAYSETGALTDTWGPLHTVKLAQGKKEADEEVQARNHVHYDYDEGAPEGGEPYELVTKTIDGAETLSKEEFDQRTTVTSYSGQSNLGWTLRKPTSVTVDPGGLNLTSTFVYDKTTGNITEMQKPGGSGHDANEAPVPSLQFGTGGSEKGQLSKPLGDAVDSTGNIWIANAGNNNLQKFSASGTWLAQYGKLGSNEYEVTFSDPAGIAINKNTSNVYVGDKGNNRIVEVNSNGNLLRMFGKAGEGAGTLKEPGGVAIDGSSAVWVADSGNNRIDKFSETGTFVEALGWGVRNGETNFQTCTSTCRKGIAGSGLGQFNAPVYIGIAKEHIYVSDANNNRIDLLSETGTPETSFGSSGSGSGQFKRPGGIAFDASGDVFVGDPGNDRVDEFTAEGKSPLRSLGTLGSGPGQLSEPEGVAIGGSGAIYVSDTTNKRIAAWYPPVAGNLGAHTLKTIYYTPESEAEVSGCRDHKEWAGLPCVTEPAEQPGVAGPTELPATEMQYNVRDQVETLTERFGTSAVKRTVHTTFDGAGRPETTEQTATEDAQIPKLTDKYNSENGSVAEQISTGGEGTKTITMKTNRYADVTKYTDAENSSTEYTYDTYGRLSTITDGSESGKGKQTYSYNEETGARTSVSDSGAGALGAGYTVGGQISEEIYPNGMVAYYRYSPTGEATAIEYKKTTYCTEEHEKCVWFKQTLTPSVHGEPLSQATSWAPTGKTTYNNAGRLTETQETPTGEGCQTHLYTYDEDGSRTSQTERAPATEGKCATEGGTSLGTPYNTGDQVTTPGVTYDKLGNVTSLPAADAGGNTLTSEYYANNALHTQTQNGETLEYKLDPEDRTREVVAKGTKAQTTVEHYDGPGGTPAWTTTSGAWTRDITGVAGELVAIETSSSAAVLQLHDLQGDIVATASLSETATEVASKIRVTEFGEPTSKTGPPPYAWEGAVGLSSEFPSGTITQDGVTYVPQTGAPLQTQPVELDLPANIAQAYSAPGPSYILGHAAWAAALETTQYEETLRAERGVDPPGEVPTPEGSGGGGCSGPMCLGLSKLERIKLSTVGCQLHHDPLGRERSTQVLVRGYVLCQATASKIVFQLCLAQYGIRGTGEKILVACLEEKGHKDIVEYNTDVVGGGFFGSCAAGFTYTGWIWAAVYGLDPLEGFGLDVQEGYDFGSAKNCSELPILPT